MLIPALGQTQSKKKTIQRITARSLARNLDDIAKNTTRQYGNEHARVY